MPGAAVARNFLQNHDWTTVLLETNKGPGRVDLMGQSRLLEGDAWWKSRHSQISETSRHREGCKVKEET